MGTQDVVGGFDPAEWLGLPVAWLHEALDGGHQGTDTVVTSAFDLTPGKEGNPAFHLIEPRGMGGSKVEVAFQ